MDKELKKEIRRTANINGLTVILSRVLMLLFSLAASIGVAIVMHSKSPYYTGTMQFVTYSAVYLVSFPMLIIMSNAMHGEKFRFFDSFRKPEKSAGWIFKWIIIGIGISHLTSFISTIVFSILQTLTNTELHAGTFTTTNDLFTRLSLFIPVTIFAPIFEESIFRGCLQGSSARVGGWSTIIINGIIFGLWHCNYPQLPFGMIFGIIACYMFQKTKSIFPGMLFHLCFNLIDGSKLLLLDMEFLSSSDHSAAETADHLGTYLAVILYELFTFGIVIAALVLLIIEIAKKSDDFSVPDQHPEVSGFKKAMVYLTSPLMLLMIVILIGYTVFNALA